MILDTAMLNESHDITLASDSTTHQRIFVRVHPLTGRILFVYKKRNVSCLCVGLPQAVAKWNEEACGERE